MGVGAHRHGRGEHLGERMRVVVGQAGGEATHAEGWGGDAPRAAPALAQRGHLRKQTRLAACMRRACVCECKCMRRSGGIWMQGRGLHRGKRARGHEAYKHRSTCTCASAGARAQAQGHPQACKDEKANLILQSQTCTHAHTCMHTQTQHTCTCVLTFTRTHTCRTYTTHLHAHPLAHTR